MLTVTEEQYQKVQLIWTLVSLVEVSLVVQSTV